MYQKWALNSIWNGQYPSYINIFYRIVRLLGNVFGNGKGFGSISTHDTVKFNKIGSIIIRFYINSILSQDIANQVFFNRKWHRQFDQLSAQILLLQTCKQKWNTNWKWKPNFFFFKNLSLASILPRFTPPLSTLPPYRQKTEIPPQSIQERCQAARFQTWSIWQKILSLPQNM